MLPLPPSSLRLAIKVWAVHLKERYAGKGLVNCSRVDSRPASLRQMRSRLLGVMFSAILVCPTAASGHDSWISRHKFRDPYSGAWCCNEHDCSPLDETRVVETKEGYVVDRKFFVPRGRAMPSYDSQYWACFNPGGLHGHGPKRDVRCFFVPMNM